jgi:hypothetical protein
LLLLLLLVPFLASHNLGQGTSPHTHTEGTDTAADEDDACQAAALLLLLLLASHAAHQKLQGLLCCVYDQLSCSWPCVAAGCCHLWRQCHSRSSDHPRCSFYCGFGCG